MKHQISKRALSALTLWALVGLACGSAPRTNFYTVRLGPGPVPASGSASGQLGVAVPQANHLLRQDRIVYFTNPSGLNFYHYHRWAESPTFMVQSALIRRLQGAGLFGDVVAFHAQKGLDYVLRSRLLAMEEVDTPTEVSARFGLELELVRQEDARVVWSGRHECERPVATKTVDTVVETLSGCMEETLNELTGSLAAAVPHLPPVTSEQRSKP